MNAHDYYEAGNMHLANNAPELAIQNYQLALQMNPNFPEVLLQCAKALNTLKIFRAALDYCTQAIKLEPTFASPYNLRALIYVDLGDYKLAARDNKTAIETDAKYVTPYYNLAKLFLKLNLVSPALAALTKAIFLCPEIAEALYFRGNIHFSRENFLLAHNDYAKVVFIQGDCTWAFYKLARTLHVMQEYTKAISNYTKWLQIIWIL